MKVCSIFSQVLKLFSRGEFEKAVKEHKAERHARGFTSWGQFMAMLFCQLGRAHSLREICGGLACCEGHLKHLGVPVAPYCIGEPMAQDYDVVLKLLFRSKSSRVVQAIAGGAVKRWLDKELPAIRNTRADLVGETAGGEIVHLEFMSENQKFFELRMAGYYVEIYQASGRHPRQSLVY